MDEHTAESSGASLLRHRWIERAARIVAMLPAAISVLAARGALAANNTTTMGTVYCGTGFETGIDLLFGAIVGLGLPASLYYLLKSGFSYMRAGPNAEQLQRSRQKLLMSGAGFGVFVFAIIAPNLITKVGTQIGFEFSQCVRPF